MSTTDPALSAPTPAPGRSPVRLDAELDPGLSRGMWLVKWLLAIPHYFVLFFLWVAFAVTTVIAGVAILFTGRYPRSLFDFNLGVLRWSWRVAYYASSGGIGTDRYPPFSLGEHPDYPARLDIAYPERLSRGLVLAALFGAATGADREATAAPGLLTVLTVVAGVVLLFTRRYPRSLFDLIVGFNRWQYRVLAYVFLMTDQYPPFRLDQGGPEPVVDVVTPTGPIPAAPQPA